MSRVAESPRERNFSNTLSVEARINQISPARQQAALADAIRNGSAIFGKQTMQVTSRNMRISGDPGRAKSRITQMGVDERLDADRQIPGWTRRVRQVESEAGGKDVEERLEFRCRLVPRFAEGLLIQ